MCLSEKQGPLASGQVETCLGLLGAVWSGSCLGFGLFMFVLFFFSSPEFKTADGKCKRMFKGDLLPVFLLPKSSGSS